jgi:hypothetical protein
MNCLPVILAFLCGVFLGFGRGVLFRDDTAGTDWFESEQPIIVQIIILAISLGLAALTIGMVAKNNLPDTPPIIAFVVGLSGTLLFFWKTGFSGEPIAEFQVNKEVYSASKENPDSQEPPEFHDDELDSLIDKGDYLGARHYLDEQLRMAKEMGDVEAMHNYTHYKTIITRATMEDTRRLGHTEDEQ